MSTGGKLAMFGGGMIASIVLLATTTNYSLQQALNQLAGNNRAPYTALSTQQAANVMLAQELARTPHGERMPGVFTIVVDDNNKEWSADSLYIQQCLAHGIGVGFTLEPEAIEAGGGTVMSLAEVTALYSLGFEMGTAGYDEIGGLYAGITSLIAQGYTVAQRDSFFDNIERGVTWNIEKGFGQPRFHSYSNSSGCQVTAAAARTNGIEYAVSSIIPPTVAGSFIDSLGEGQRNNAPYPPTVARWGAWGSGGAGAWKVSAHRGWHGNPYEIAQTLAESNTYANWKEALSRASQIGGLIVLNLHRASDCEASTGVSWDSLMTLVEEKIDAGYLVSMNPSDAFDYYWKRAPSPLTRYEAGVGNFDDIDGDGHLDMWAANQGGLAVADTALIKPWGAATSGHDGRKAYSLNWTGGEGGSPIIGGATISDPWEAARAWHGVLPPQGGGYTVRFECWIIADSAGASYTAISGDTVGVTFYGITEGLTNRWGTTTPNWNAISGASGTYGPSTSHTLYGNLVGPSIGNFIRLGSRNNASRATNKQWASLIATWEVPEFVDYVIVALWKTAQSPANGIVISDYSITFHNRGAIAPAYLVSEGN